MLDTHTIPPGGWQFTQPQTGYRLPTPISSTFDQSCSLILKHRLANPAITRQHNLSTDLDVIGHELMTFTKRRLKITDDASPKPVAPASIAQRVGAVAAVVRSIGVGAGNLLAWSDNGKVVPREVAEARAAVCVTCPRNGKGDWRKIFTGPAVSIIQNQLATKNSMQLATSKDEQLKVCEACWCPLSLKVWAPLEYALRKMSQDTKDRLVENCWMKTEK